MPCECPAPGGPYKTIYCPRDRVNKTPHLWKLCWNGAAIGEAAPHTFISVEQLAADAKALASRLPDNLAGIVGIPRSGMIPATILATQLHLPLYELDKYRGLCKLGVGSRIADDVQSGVLLVVDDSKNSGKSLARAKQQLPDALFCVMYPSSPIGLDFFARITLPPHLFEWNYLNCAQTKHFALDFDGILCHDWVPGDDYERFIRTVLPLSLPRKSPVTIITGRDERYRAPTEAWLARWGVRVTRLIMREQDEPHAPYKARHYRISDCKLFVESNVRQAREIWQLSDKPVLCPTTGHIFADGASCLPCEDDD